MTVPELLLACAVAGTLFLLGCVAVMRVRDARRRRAREQAEARRLRWEQEQQRQAARERERETARTIRMRRQVLVALDQRARLLHVLHARKASLEKREDDDMLT